MSTWAIGLSTGCFYRQSIFDCLEPIRESGFSMIEVCFSPVHLDYHDLGIVRRASSRIAELGMETYSFHAPFADDIDISSPDPHRRKSALEEILRAAEAAAELQVQYFVIHPGPEHSETKSGAERYERRQNVAETLDQVAARCRALGIGCVLENKLPHLLFGNATDIVAILRAIAASGMGACLDTGHGFLSGDLLSLMKEIGPYVRMLHAHDNRGNGDDHRPPGDGGIDWISLLRGLAASQFKGAIILELAGETTIEATLANARSGRSYLRRLCRKLTFEES